jgi:hypothetical protein
MQKSTKEFAIISSTLFISVLNVYNTTCYAEFVKFNCKY